MFAPATFENFQQELARLVEKFDRDYPQFVAANYNEATLRNEFLDPFFRALGWDVGNINGLIHTEREVDIEVHTATSGRQTRADYVFRYARVERFTCEAKKPAEALSDRHIYQAKRDAFARGVPFALLSDFEDLKIYIVGARPHRDEPHVGEFKILNFRQYVLAAREIWDLLAYEQVRNGSLDREIAKLPKRPLKLKGRPGYLIRPDRTRSLDADFLNFLDDARQQLGSDLLQHNDRADLLSGHRLNEAAQRIIDRLIFLRICEDRGIDTGELLHSLFDHWYRQQTQPPRLRRPGRQSHLRFGGGTDGSEAVGEEPDGFGSARDRIEGSLYRGITDHVRSLDHRPASHKPYFNGQLFTAHFSEDLIVGDEWLANFILDLTDDDTGYNFAAIKVEILGDAYERFLGRVLRPQGRGATIDWKPEYRKQQGVYYTPRYITDYIVERTIGRLLEGKLPREVEKLRFVDPACGSGSFLLRAYERVMEHYLRWFIAHPAQQKKAECYTDAAGNVRLTTALKRRILVNNIYGVDIDAQAVEVTQLSLYLKMLEDENRDTLRTQPELFRGEPLLPPLDKNIRCFNSLIASDFSLDAAELVRVNAGDWDMQFPSIMKGGGFDAVVGNPPYLYSAGQDAREYFAERFRFTEYQTDFYAYFVERGLALTKRKVGVLSFIVSDSWLKAENFSKLRNHLLTEHCLQQIAVFDFPPFEGATIENSIFIALKGGLPSAIPIDKFSSPGVREKVNEIEPASAVASGIIDARYSDIAAKLISKMERGSATLDSLLDLNRGIHAYRTDGYGKSKFASGPQTKRDKETRSYHATERLDKTYLPELRGKDVCRFHFVPTGDFVSYGDWLAEPREERYFKNPKIALRKVLGRKLHGTFLSGAIALDQSLYVGISPTNDTPALKFALGLLLSTIGAWFLRTKYGIYDALYPWYTRKQLGNFPIKTIEPKMVQLVEKMMALTSALRAATSDAERRAVENALAKTDHDIDQLVYQLYALTPAEIALVEGLPASDAGAGNPAPALEAN